MDKIVFRILLLIVAVSLAGCATTTAKKNTMATFQWTSPTKRIVLVQPDIELSELDAGGVLEPRADWTDTARGVINKGLRLHFTKSGAVVVDAQGSTAHEVQLIKLHGVVGQEILTHLYAAPQGTAAGNAPLPNKGTALDWTLGPGTNEMRDRYGADYALFVFVRDSYSSAARKALDVLTVIAGAALGVGIIPASGLQIGFASLVDLRTGNVVWYNRLLNGSGDLRDEKTSTGTVDELLKDLPI